MKYGRRPWVRRLRARHKANRDDAARLHTDEHRVSIEIGLMSFSRYRAEPEWQWLGWWGRWKSLWAGVARAYRWERSPISALDEIYKRRYSQSDPFERAVRRFSGLMAERPGFSGNAFFDLITQETNRALVDMAEAVAGEMYRAPEEP